MEECLDRCHNCFWWECFACDGAKTWEEISECTKELTIQDDKYYYYTKFYQKEVEKALKPIRKKMKDIYNEIQIN